MKLKFKQQQYQQDAVDAVIACFAGQPKTSGSKYQIDLGTTTIADYFKSDQGYKNSDINKKSVNVIENIQQQQDKQNIIKSTELVTTDYASINLDIEMETGTGKTYCYIKTCFELYEKIGWNKFIIVVPSIAIREGVFKTLEITAEHFYAEYQQKAKFFIYNSKQLHNIETFSEDTGINIMVINIQAFNATGKDNRRIYEKLDSFQTRKPIDVIKANKPIIILDEPQKMAGKKTLTSLAEFNPLFALHYSATHKIEHNKIYCLDALDAYKQKLVKKIAVRGISQQSFTGAYLYLSAIEISKQAPIAKIELKIKYKTGIKLTLRNFKEGDNLYEYSNEIKEYKDLVITDINYKTGIVAFTNGNKLQVGELTGNTEETSILRRIQIREAINAHFEKEQSLFHNGIKVLSLFFIDEVAKYRQYTADGEQLGEYAQMFIEEYERALADIKTNNTDAKYLEYLEKISADKTHNGYFSIDKKGKLVDAIKLAKKEENTETDPSAYDLILKDKERLLSFNEPTRFIFSHSALREGWDNPNVFVICTLKNTSSDTNRRQEVGRGLRLAVNQFGERQDDQATVHEINKLTVVTNESYNKFVSELQQDIKQSLANRPTKANADYFTGKTIETAKGSVTLTKKDGAIIEYYLIQNHYIDYDHKITEKYQEDLATGKLAELPKNLQPYATGIETLIANIDTDTEIPIENECNKRENKRNTNFDKKEFQQLWQKINHQAIYQVNFNSDELIKNCIEALNAELTVKTLKYNIERGEQQDDFDREQLAQGKSFVVTSTKTSTEDTLIHSQIKYDLIGEITKSTELTRKTIASILTKLTDDKFNLFKQNPEDFIINCTKLIKEQLGTIIIEYLRYNTLDKGYDVDIFTPAEYQQDFTTAMGPLKKHIYDYLIADSKIEQQFAENLDTSDDIVVYAKLPKEFTIPTPVGSYNPDWAISFKQGKVKHIYFIAETKGSLSSMQLRKAESIKIDCARKFFDTLKKKFNHKDVRYDVVDSFDKLMEIVNS